MVNEPRFVIGELVDVVALPNAVFPFSAENVHITEVKKDFDGFWYMHTASEALRAAWGAHYGEDNPKRVLTNEKNIRKKPDRDVGEWSDCIFKPMNVKEPAA